MAPFISSSVRETDSGFLCRELFHIRFGISLIFISGLVFQIFFIVQLFSVPGLVFQLFFVSNLVFQLFFTSGLAVQYFISALEFSYCHIRITSVISDLTFFMSGLVFNMFISICYLICSYPEGEREGKGEVRHSRKRQRDKKHTHTVYAATGSGQEYVYEYSICTQWLHPSLHNTTQLLVLEQVREQTFILQN